MTEMPVREVSSHTAGELGPADAVIEVGEHLFAMKFVSASSSAQIHHAIEMLRGACSKSLSGSVPLIVVPYMGEVGDKLCREYDVSWLDFSGNAGIKAKNLFISVKGEINKFKRRGRNKSVFSPKSSRLVRWLLYNRETEFRQIQLANDTSLNQGYVSTIVNRMLELDYITIDEDSLVRLQQPRRLYEDWRAAYDFKDHEVKSGVIPARGGVRLTEKVAGVLKDNEIEYAATGMAAAWRYTQFATYRLAAFYMSQLPEPGVLDDLGFQPLESGANIWFVIPSDSSVLWGSREVEGLECVHPLQVCLDLKDHPGRSETAYLEMQNRYLRLG